MKKGKEKRKEVPASDPGPGARKRAKRRVIGEGGAKGGSPPPEVVQLTKKQKAQLDVVHAAKSKQDLPKVPVGPNGEEGGREIRAQEQHSRSVFKVWIPLPSSLSQPTRNRGGWGLTFAEPRLGYGWSNTSRCLIGTPPRTRSPFVSSDTLALSPGSAMASLCQTSSGGMMKSHHSSKSPPSPPLLLADH